MQQPIIVKKVDEVADVVKPPPEKKDVSAGGGGGKTTKTFPRGILKTAKRKFHLKPVADPAKPPHIKRSMKRQTVRITNDKIVKKQRHTLKQKIRKMSDAKVKHLVQKNGLLKNPNTPVSVMREMLEGGSIAGFVSLH
jgi:hypothetical protein